MTKKKEYPGGVKLTLKKARAVAIQEFGTAKGLEKEGTAMPGYFTMKLRNLHVRIHPDTYDGTGCIVVSAELAFATGRTRKFLDPETLQDNYDALERDKVCGADRGRNPAFPSGRGPRLRTAGIFRSRWRGLSPFFSRCSILRSPRRSGTLSQI